MTEHNLEDDLNESEKWLVDGLKKIREKERLKKKEEFDRIKAIQRTQLYRPEYTYKKTFPTGKVVSAICGIALLAAGIVYRNDIGNYFKSNANSKTTEFVDPVQEFNNGLIASQNSKNPVISDRASNQHATLNDDIPKTIRNEYTVVSGTYTIDHDVIVKKNGKLIINEGCTINFKEGKRIDVEEGLLKILGTVDKPVTLDAIQNHLNSTQEYWEGIVIKNSDQENIIQYTTIRYAKKENIHENIEDGGGIYIEKGKLDIQHSKIENCAAFMDGGGMFIKYSNVRIENSEIINNNAHMQGGGIYSSNSEINILQSDINQNSSYSDGGGIYNSNTILNIKQCNIINNKGEDGGGIAGGSLDNESKINIELTLLKGNHANYDGGGLRPNGAELILKRCSIIQNTAYEGGGIYHDGKNITIENTKITDNQVEYNVGGIYSHMDIDHISISGNTVIENNYPNDIRE